MHGRIVSILVGLRARLIAVRSAEAAAVGAAAGGVVAAFLMAGRIVAGLYPAAGAALSAGPLAVASALIISHRLRAGVSSRPQLQWYVIALAGGAGVAGVAWTLSGAFVHVPKNWLSAAVPVGALAAATITLVRGASLRDAALAADRLGQLKERLSTALELCDIDTGSSFAEAVHTQASAAAGEGDLRSLRFWDRTRATIGALVLAVLAAVLMLPWDVLVSPVTRQRRQWQELAPAAAEVIGHSLAGLGLWEGGDPAVEEKLRRLEAMAGNLRAARAEEAPQWRGKIIELDELSEALRRAVESGRLDPATEDRLRDLIAAIERAAGQLDEGMAQVQGELRPVQPRPVPPPATAMSAPAGWASVFNLEYAKFAKTRPGDVAPAGENMAAPPIRAAFDQQWDQARHRAAEALQRQTIPPEYHQLVRDFYAAPK